MNIFYNLWTPSIFEASAYGDLKTIINFIKSGADLDVRTRQGNTPLIIASIKGFFDIVHTLVMYGSDVNIQNNVGANALISSIMNKHPEISKFLIIQGTDLNVQTTQGNTALMTACVTGNLELVKIIMSYPDTKVNLENIGGHTAIMIAAGLGHKDIVMEILKDPRININYVSKTHRTLYNCSTPDIQDFLNNKYKDILRLTPPKLQQQIHNELLSRKLGKGYRIFSREVDKYLFGKRTVKSRNRKSPKRLNKTKKKSKK